ncbi:MAG: YbaK/EbsC family protein [Marivibrio sp.]|uniref:YbaK/EbsC family protein n=1 Tax=Marivibrio sp. TaxID=2039719 RepID=UPI0032F0337A
MPDAPALKPAAKRLQEALDAFGLDLKVIEFPASTRTSEEAAEAIGCSVRQIAKSVILRGKRTDRPILVVASGVNRVDEKKVKALIGEKPGRADADFVRARTGFAIGGVAPVGHAEAPVTLLDRDLADLEEIWAAAGTPNAVFRLTPDQLARITGGQWVDVRQE